MSKQAITVLLQRVKAGEKELLNDIYTRLYSEIKSIARLQIKKLQTGETITPTVLAHDCYLKVIKQNHINIHDSQHFLNCLSISMRQLLIDAYRSKLSAKHHHIDLTQDFGEIQGNTDIDFKILELDRLLAKIQKIDNTYAKILDYKIILSMTFPEIARVIGKSERQTIRIWNQAKSLMVALSKEK
jgi:RNA polymerase sigma factor (TIGR02999 family)